MRELTLSVPENESYKRLDIYLSDRLAEYRLTRSQAKRLIEKGCVLIDNLPVKPSTPLKGGETIMVSIPSPEPIELEPEPIPLDIIYEDSAMIVVNKPAGMVVHAGAGVRSGTLVNALLAHCKDLSMIGDRIRPGIVHRLDKDTSGVIVVAKDGETHISLSTQFKERKVEKHYIALVKGRIEQDSGVIDTMIGRHPQHRKKMSTKVRRGREAITRYLVKERFGAFTLLDVKPETGRTHQIRVHLSFIHHPVVGDKVYGRGVAYNVPAVIKEAIGGLKGHALHAHSIKLFHPIRKEDMVFTAPLPDDLIALINRLRGCEDMG